MEGAINSQGLADLLRIVWLLLEQRRWEKELRKANSRCVYSRKLTAEKRVEDLKAEYDELRRQMRKREVK